MWQGGLKKLCFDCSGFVYYYFLQIGKFKAIDEIRNFIALQKGIDINLIRRIYAWEYVDFFTSVQSSRYWQLVDPLHLKRGDLIVYATNEKPRHSHCMLVDNVIESDGKSVTLAVVDSTRTRHIDETDTRAPYQTGIGRGNIILYPVKGKCTSFLWGRYVNHRDLFFARIRE